MNTDDLQYRFRFHPSTAREKAGEHGTIRESCLRLALLLDELLPDGREKSLAITKLEEVMFWGSEAIARDVLL